MRVRLEQIGFGSKENSTTRRARGYLKQIYSFVMFTSDWRGCSMSYMGYMCTFPTSPPPLPCL